MTDVPPTGGPAGPSIRDESPSDRPAVFELNRAAFPTDAEARLVDILRERVMPLISLVAEVDGELAGHILFTPVAMDGDAEARLMGLAPMAVDPARQRRGIGSALVREGLARCGKIGADAIVVLGHPSYYPRFGFAPASGFGIGSEYDVPDEAFMIVELVPGCLDGVSGIVRYDTAFAEVEEDN